MPRLIDALIVIEKKFAPRFPRGFLRIVKFGAVGMSGVVVNEGVLAVLTVWQGDAQYRIWSAIAIELSIISNFVLNSLWTWYDRPAETRVHALRRLLKFNASAGAVAFIFNWIPMVLITEASGMNHLLSNLIGIAFASGMNFLTSHFWTFRKKL